LSSVRKGHHILRKTKLATIFGEEGIGGSDVCITRGHNKKIASPIQPMMHIFLHVAEIRKKLL